jgi:hypothetical protein
LVESSTCSAISPSFEVVNSCKHTYNVIKSAAHEMLIISKKNAALGTYAG